MGDVIIGNFDTTLDIPPERVLKEAIGVVDPVLLIGYDTEGELYVASSTADAHRLLWLIETAKLYLLTKADVT